MMNIALPSSWHIFENYKEMIIEGGVIRGFFNSVIVTGVSVFLLVVLCSAMAFILERKKDRLSGMVNAIVILGLVLPLQIIPTYFVCDFFHEL